MMAASMPGLFLSGDRPKLQRHALADIALMVSASDVESPLGTWLYHFFLLSRHREEQTKNRLLVLALDNSFADYKLILSVIVYSLNIYNDSMHLRVVKTSRKRYASVLESANNSVLV